MYRYKKLLCQHRKALEALLAMVKLWWRSLTWRTLALTSVFTNVLTMIVWMSYCVNEKDRVHHLRLKKPVEGAFGGVAGANLAQYDEIILSEIAPRPDSFFMVETSGRREFDVKELCAIESTAKHHPNSTIYVLSTSPTISYSGPLVNVMTRYDNINVKHLNFEAFLMGTPLEVVWNDGRIQRSKYLLSHLSDILRWLILYRYGGTYMDLDQIVLKPFPRVFPNFIGQEKYDTISVGVVRLKHSHGFSKAMVDAMARSFDGSNFQANGPAMALNTMYEFCDVRPPYNLTQIVNSSLQLCQGLKVFTKKHFYPVRWEDWKEIFDPNKCDQVINKRLRERTLSLHCWGAFSRDIQPNFSRLDTAYSKLAFKNCPVTFNSGRRF